MRRQKKVDRLWENLLEALAFSNWSKVQEFANELQVQLDSRKVPDVTKSRFAHRLAPVDYMLAIAACDYAKEQAAANLKNQALGKPRKRGPKRKK